MADLTAEQIFKLRAELGDAEPPTNDDLNEIYQVRGGLVGVVRHVWSQRLAALIATPATFSVIGDYSQSTSANIAAIRQRLVDLSAYPDTSDDIPPGGAVVMFKTIPMVRVGQAR